MNSLNVIVARKLYYFSKSFSQLFYEKIVQKAAENYRVRIWGRFFLLAKKRIPPFAS